MPLNNTRYSASRGGPLNSPMSAPEKKVEPSHMQDHAAQRTIAADDLSRARREARRGPPP